MHKEKKNAREFSFAKELHTSKIHTYKEWQKSCTGYCVSCATAEIISFFIFKDMKGDGGKKSVPPCFKVTDYRRRVVSAYNIELWSYRITTFF